MHGYYSKQNLKSTMAKKNCCCMTNMEVCAPYEAMPLDEIVRPEHACESNSMHGCINLGNTTVSALLNAVVVHLFLAMSFFLHQYIQRHRKFFRAEGVISDL